LTLLPRLARVDGVDLDAAALAVARTRAAAVGGACDLVSDLDELAAKGRRYDLIFINSVLQYLPDVDAVRRTLGRLRELLTSAPDAEIIVADLLPETYAAARDALRGLAFAAGKGVLIPMVIHLAKAATMPGHLSLLRLGPETFARLAQEVGLRCEVLPRNLTPSRERFSVRLTRAGAA
jgi:ubiquinone/menaquinone biosynthesis C-methylase UbiE